MMPCARCGTYRENRMRQGLRVTVCAAAMLAAAPVRAQQPGGMMPGMMGAGRDSGSMAMMRVVHEMMTNHAKLRRTVTNLPNGVRTVTESDDPAMIQAVQGHVATTGELVRTAHDPNLPMESPVLRGVLRNGDKVTRTVERTANGVIVVETSSDSATVALLQQHAAEVTALVERGMAAMHEAMMKNGGMGAMGRGMMPAMPPMAADTTHAMPAGMNHQAMHGGAAPAPAAMDHNAMHGAMPGMQHGNTDSAFAAVQARGRMVMGVDQYTSTHHFDVREDGGRIELQRDVDDPAGVAQIRTHLQSLAAAFASGDFSSPAMVHMQTVPGTAVMAEKKAVIRYRYRPLPRGGELRMTTRDPAAKAAIAEFLAFQRMDHRAP